MSVDLRQNDDGSFGMAGVDAGQGVFEFVQFNYTATFASTSVYTAQRTMVVKSLQGRVDVAGTGGACTLEFRKVASGTAGASGTLLHTGTFNVAGTANTNQTLTLATNPQTLRLAAGESVFVVLTGTPTSAVGSVTLGFLPA